MKTVRTVRLLIAGFVAATTAQAANVWELADAILAAQRENQPIPLVCAISPDLDAAGAYLVQKIYLRERLRSNRVAGFKAGLTSKEAQEKLGATTPVAGVLLESGGHRAGQAVVVALSSFRRLAVESEFAFVLAQDVTARLETPDQFKMAVRGVVPVIELADLAYGEATGMKAEDIIAANVWAAQYILGAEKPVADLDLNATAVTLSKDGAAVSAGKGADALGDQWEAGRWLVNTMLDAGWEIKAGQVLLTGALGTVLDGSAGKYVADFGPLGSIAFEIQ